jgi:hypothetical protein
VSRLARGVGAALAALALSGAVLHAQVEMVPDRPEFTATSSLVGAGRVEFDEGITVGGQDRTHGFSGPEPMLRVGVTKRIELRLDTNGFLAQWVSGAPMLRGRSDVEVSAKVGLFEQRHFRPAISLITDLSIPAGSKDFTSGGYDPMVKLAWDKDLVDGFAAGGNLDWELVTTPEGRISQKAASLSLSRGLGSGFGFFSEVYAVSSLVTDNPVSWSTDAGLTWAAGKNLEIDLRVGKHLNEPGPNWFCGAGIAVRRPAKWFSR